MAEVRREQSGRGWEQEQSHSDRQELRRLRRPSRRPSGRRWRQNPSGSNSKFLDFSMSLISFSFFAGFDVNLFVFSGVIGRTIAFLHVLQFGILQRYSHCLLLVLCVRKRNIS